MPVSCLLVFNEQVVNRDGIIGLGVKRNYQIISIVVIESITRYYYVKIKLSPNPLLVANS